MLAIRHDVPVVAELSPESGEPLFEQRDRHGSGLRQPVSAYRLDWVCLLSERQRDVMQLVAHGYTEYRIARTLGIGVWIVKADKGRARELLSARNVPHAVYLALHAGLIA